MTANPSIRGAVFSDVDHSGHEQDAATYLEQVATLVQEYRHEWISHLRLRPGDGVSLQPS